jgi:hypothetical protein
MMHEHGKSDSPIVPAKPPNEAEPGEAEEAVEGRGLVKGKTPERNMSRTQGRSGMSSAFERIRQAARRDKGQRFTALQVSTARRGGSMERGLRVSFWTSLIEFDEEHTGHSRRAELISPRRVSQERFGRWGCSSWKIKSSSAQQPKCSATSMSRTL